MNIFFQYCVTVKSLLSHIEGVIMWNPKKKKNGFEQGGLFEVKKKNE